MYRMALATGGVWRHGRPTAHAGWSGHRCTNCSGKQDPRFTGKQEHINPSGVHRALGEGTGLLPKSPRQEAQLTFR